MKKMLGIRAFRKKIFNRGKLPVKRKLNAKATRASLKDDGERIKIDDLNNVVKRYNINSFITSHIHLASIFIYAFVKLES